MGIGKLVEKELKKKDAFSSDNSNELKEEIRKLIEKIDKVLKG